MIEISSIQQLDEALAAHELLLFKHSTRCPVSAAAQRRVEQYESGQPGGALPIYRIKVIEARSLSDAVAHRLGVTHQSPQMIFIRDGRVIWQASHRAITAEALAAAVDLR